MEGARPHHPPPLGVEDEHAVVVEVGDVQAPACEREPAEDRAGGSRVDRDLGLRRPAARDVRSPASDHAVLAGEDEPRGRRPAASVHDESVAAAVHDSGRPAFDLDREELLSAPPVVEGARAAGLVGDPPDSVRACRQAPRVDELRVGAVGDQAVDDEAVRAGASGRARDGKRGQSDGQSPRCRLAAHVTAPRSATAGARRAGS